jgi:DNA-binding beta-propeller fold protein YncE
MRMKFNKKSQLLLVSVASLMAAGMVTACSTLTVDFVYVTSSLAAGTDNYGEVDVFEINSESGYMRQIPTSPFPSGGRNPVAEALSSDNQSLYVVNKDDNTIVQFFIGNDGKVYPQSTVNTPGIFPVAATVSGSSLFVIDTYQPLPACSNASPCSGSVGVFPIVAPTGSALGSALGTPVANGSLTYWPLALTGAGAKDILLPTGVAALANGADLFVSAYDTTANTGYIFGFAIGSGGALTPLAGSPWKAGTHPSALVGDSTSAYLYVTDYSGSDVLGYAVSGGGLTPLSGSPYPAGGLPSAIAVDPGAKYLYVTNSQDSTITAYSNSGGPLTRIGSYATGLQPVAIGVDPGMKHFVFTANFLGNSVSGLEINTDGSLFGSQNSPYTSNAQPTAAVAIPHNGNQK